MDVPEPTDYDGESIAARTHVGRVRAANEDAYGIAPDRWVLCDGMGGHRAGEVAARIVVDETLDVLSYAEQITPQVLTEAIRSSRIALDVAAGADPALSGMGTTVVIAARTGDTLTVAHVGDSRAYLLDGDALTPLTRDHNLAEELLELGLITAEQARVHPGQYHLTRALSAGGAAGSTPTVTSAPAAGRLLLCSDGLTSELDDASVARLLGSGDVAAAAQALVDAAVEAGGSDNVTVLVVDL